MELKLMIGALLGGAIGAAVGYSKVLCWSGSCPLTGTWPGGMVYGVLLGAVIAGSLWPSSNRPPRDRESSTTQVAKAPTDTTSAPATTTEPDAQQKH